MTHDPRAPDGANWKVTGVEPDLLSRQRSRAGHGDPRTHGEQIGELLFIGRRTLEMHLGRARNKLGGRNKRELTAQTYDTRGEPQSASWLPRKR
jgi:hypothetical protein